MSNFNPTFKKTIAVIWASSYSLLGLLIGTLGIISGGKGRLKDGAVEFYGGGTQWFVRRLPPGIHTAGFTLGHVILGQSDAGLDLNENITQLCTPIDLEFGTQFADTAD